MRKHRTRNLEIPGLVLTHHPGMTIALSRNRHLFKKFSGNPGRGQSIAISSPLPDSVM